MSDQRFWIPDAQFARLQPRVPDKSRGVPRVDDRRVTGGIVHVIRGRLTWLDAPASCILHADLCDRVALWSRAGVFDGIFLAPAAPRRTP